MFQALGAAPTSINFSEVYSALQTHIADGEENPLAVIDAAKLYEVQKFCSLTNHMWDGFWLLANRRAFERLPEDARTIVAREFNSSALDERQDVAKLNGQLKDKLASGGMQFNNIEREPFRARLKAAGFYKDWRARFGDEAWQTLEAAVGELS
jgi:TRAP-type C4-dicarboxylate transport system substrate-binding protein